MATKISATLINKLPAGERKNIEKALKQKAGGKCFLCAEGISEAADTLVADHDKPEAEGGPTEISNLNLVHQQCNSAKRNSPTIDVRPYLRLTAYIRKNGPLLTYGKLLDHFSIKPKPTEVHIHGNQAEFKFADGTAAKVQIHSEKNKKGTFRYAFVEVPRSAIFNDEECQPRNVKHTHVWSIYSDLQRNPLHEAPGCRLEITGSGDLANLLMFDGQHKTVATWMLGRSSILAKVYLDLTAHQAIELVNSIQSKIKKLPLSPFELAAKMSDEWANKVADFEAKYGVDDFSEEAFIKWLPPDERTRAKQALAGALVQEILDDDNLEFKHFVARAGEKSKIAVIPETAFKSKVLEQLLFLAPLSEKGMAGTEIRALEHSNIVRVLNTWVQAGFLPEVGATELSPQQAERMRRMRYQASLKYISTLVKEVFGHKLYQKSPKAFIKGNPTPEQWTKIEEAIKRIADHPVWSADLDSSAKLRKIKDALEKNQDIVDAFEAVRLDAGYADGATKIKPKDLEG